MSMMSQNHNSRLSIVIQTRKVPRLNCALIWILTRQHFQFQSKIDCFFFSFDVFTDSEIVFAPVLIFFIVELLEKVLTKEFDHFNCATMASSNMILNLLNHCFWLDITLFKNNKWRHRCWIYRWIIQPKVIVGRQWFHTKDNPYRLVDHPFNKNSLCKTRIEHDIVKHGIFDELNYFKS